MEGWGEGGGLLALAQMCSFCANAGCIVVEGITAEIEQLFPLVSAAPCPHHHKPDPAFPVGLATTPTSDGCRQCAAAPALTDGAAPVCTEKDEAENGAVGETDGEGGEEKGKKRREGRGTRGRCCRKPCSDVWYDTRMKLWEIVESKYFNRGIMIAILINTISMGIEHHEQVRPRPPPPSQAGPRPARYGPGLPRPAG